MGYFCPKKYIPLAKTLCTGDLSNITFNYLCKNSPNDLCHFLNHKSFFTTRLLCIFLSQTLHISTKVAYQSENFQTCHCLHYKIHPIPHVIFGTKSQFFFKFCTTLQCHETNCSVLFHLNLYMLWTKGFDQSATF